MTIDLSALWDFANPALSESRFRAELEKASGDDALILHTQIARTYGLRREFSEAAATLDAIAGQIESAGPEARIRYQLERGRTLASAAHPPEPPESEARARARSHYFAALALATQEKFDNLAIDAVHMMAFVDQAPLDQLKWAERALEIVERSDQPSAKNWEASIRNNLGYALHQIGRYPEALSQFEEALELRKRGQNAQGIWIADWMVAKTLRAMNRIDEALAIQLRLEAERDAKNKPSPYVYEELEVLYRAKNDVERADAYAAKRSSLPA